jgi:hypothetical protein
VNDVENGIKDTDSTDTKQISEDTVSVDLYIANAGKGERTGGPYLDDVERHNAETWRAQKEGREPDYDNPPATAGTVLVPKSQLVERDTDKSHFSDNVEVTNKPYTTVQVQTDVTKPDPAQPNFDNDYDRLKGLEAQERLSKVGGEDKVGQPAYAESPVAEHSNTESQRTDSDVNSSDDETDMGEGLWDSDDTVNPSNTGDSANH